jgi:hypothetical protein
MVRAAVIENGVVTNLVAAEDHEICDSIVPAQDDTEIGDAWDGAQFSRAPISDAQLREEFKARRAAAVAAIVVTVDGMRFDGDEVSQSRMARAVVVMEPAGVEATDWVLHDNSKVSVTVAQLRQALALAGAEQTRLWVEA